jgi:RecA-family ATPase
MEGETAMIWAATGVGKSWLALSIALAVAGGGEVLGWRAAQPSRVRYIDGEMTERTVQGRLRTLLDSGAVEGLDREAAAQNLKIESRQGQALTVDFHDLLNLEHQDRLLDELRRDRVDLVIFDNFTTLSDSLGDAARG